MRNPTPPAKRWLGPRLPRLRMLFSTPLECGSRNIRSHRIAFLPRSATLKFKLSSEPSGLSLPANRKSATKAKLSSQLPVREDRSGGEHSLLVYTFNELVCSEAQESTERENGARRTFG